MNQGERESCYADCVDRYWERHGKKIALACAGLTVLGAAVGRGPGLVAGLSVSAGVAIATVISVDNECKKECWLK